MDEKLHTVFPIQLNAKNFEKNSEFTFVKEYQFRQWLQVVDSEHIYVKVSDFDIREVCGRILGHPFSKKKNIVALVAFHTLGELPNDVIGYTSADTNNPMDVTMYVAEDHMGMLIQRLQILNKGVVDPADWVNITPETKVWLNRKFGGVSDIRFRTSNIQDVCDVASWLSMYTTTKVLDEEHWYRMLTKVKRGVVESIEEFIQYLGGARNARDTDCEIQCSMFHPNHGVTESRSKEVDEIIEYLENQGYVFDFNNRDKSYWISNKDGSPRWLN